MKKLFSLVLALSMALALTACSSSADTDSTTTDDTTETTAEPVELHVFAAASMQESLDQVSEAYKAVEQVAEDKLLSMLPEDLRPAYEDALRPADPEIEQLVRAADKLSAHIKCIEELKAGNTEFRQAAAQTAAAMDAMALPELDYFREHFLPSYSLTLDELE